MAEAGGELAELRQAGRRLNSLPESHVRRTPPAVTLKVP